MAADFHLGLDRIKGESVEHQGWIKCKPIKYFKVEMENVQTAHCAGILCGELAGDGRGLKFSKVKWKDTQQKVGRWSSREV
nr:hypothetical protein [uncultured Massilia sp.]